MSDTSLSLLERASTRGDREAWRKLADVYTPLLHSWLRRYELQASDIDDVVQNVLLHVSEQLPTFRHNGRAGAFRNWLRQVLVFRLRTHWAASKRRPAATGESEFLEQLHQLEDPASGLSRLWDREHDRHVAKALVELVRGRLSEQSCAVLERTVIAGESPSAVARELGMTPNAVYAARFRVLQLLRQAGEGLLDTDFPRKTGIPDSGRESA
jgi:RNA polymerase sigma-70 factor (ECF subfamily)